MEGHEVHRPRFQNLQRRHHPGHPGHDRRCDGLYRPGLRHPRACLLNGAVQNVDSATDQFLTFCVDPLADALQEEINRKRNGLEGLRQGNFGQFDTGRIKHIDLLGQPLICEDWAWKHFMTKNYANIEKVLTALVEGEQT